MKGVRLAGRAFIACRTAPTSSRSSLAGVAAGIGAGFGSRSEAPLQGRTRAQERRRFARGLARLQNRRCGRGLRRDELGRGSGSKDGLVLVRQIERAFDRRHRRRNGIRRRILFCHRVRLTPFARDRRNDWSRAPMRFPGCPGRLGTPRINHVAVYRLPSRMETAAPAQLANVVNASVTMFFHSVQPIKGRERHGGSPGGDKGIARDGRPCLRARPASIPLSILFIWRANASATPSSRPNCSGFFACKRGR